MDRETICRLSELFDELAAATTHVVLGRRHESGWVVGLLQYCLSEVGEANEAILDVLRARLACCQPQHPTSTEGRDRALAQCESVGMGLPEMVQRVVDRCLEDAWLQQDLLPEALPPSVNPQMLPGAGHTRSRSPRASRHSGTCAATHGGENSVEMSSAVGSENVEVVQSPSDDGLCPSLHTTSNGTGATSSTTWTSTTRRRSTASTTCTSTSWMCSPSMCCTSSLTRVDSTTSGCWMGEQLVNAIGADWMGATWTSSAFSPWCLTSLTPWLCCTPEGSSWLSLGCWTLVACSWAMWHWLSSASTCSSFAP